MLFRNLLSVCMLIAYLSRSHGSSVDETGSSVQPVYNDHSTAAPIPHSENPEPQPVVPSAITRYSRGTVLYIKQTVQFVIQFFKSIGVFMLGLSVYFVMAGLFTTTVCAVTPFCTITFHGWCGMDSMDERTKRSLPTPERLSTAAAMVQDAISRYDRFQRSSNS